MKGGKTWKGKREENRREKSIPIFQKSFGDRSMEVLEEEAFGQVKRQEVGEKQGQRI